MGKKNKAQGVGAGAGRPEESARGDAMAAAAKHVSKKKKGASSLTQSLVSVGVLILAIGATVLLSSAPESGASADVPPPVSGSSKPAAENRASAKKPPVRGGKDFVPAKDRVQDQAFRPTNEHEQCESWARDGECENNAALMSRKCPSTCAKHGGGESKKKKAKKTSKDKHDNCAVWAAVSGGPRAVCNCHATATPPPRHRHVQPPQSGECEANPNFMLSECASACSGDPSEPEDVHQDCAAWVSDGECYRNPAFMLQQCKK